MQEISEINRHNINSLWAGSKVLEYLLIQNDYNLTEALKDYKGSKTNFEPVKNVLKTYNEIKSNKGK